MAITQSQALTMLLGQMLRLRVKDSKSESVVYIEILT